MMSTQTGDLLPEKKKIMARLSAQSLVSAFLLNGLPGVQNECGSHKDPRPQLRSVLDRLANENVDTSPIAGYIADLTAERASNRGGRGKKAPIFGETGVYTVQRNKTTGALFMTIPVVAGCCGDVEAGDMMPVKFGKKISIG